MERGSSSVSVAQGLRGYLRRKGFRRLERSDSRRRNERPRRRMWRMRVRPRLQVLRRLSPVRFLGKVRDAYVKMMMAMANSRVFAGGYGGGDWGAGFRAPPAKEYDEKVILEIYKMMLAKDLAMARLADAGR